MTENPIDKIIERVKGYNPEADADAIRRAYEYAKTAHEGQKRLTGDPYIIHPIATANTLCDLEMDTSSVIAALLHDVVEDATHSVEDIEKDFGPEVAKLVDGVTKLKLSGFNVDLPDESEESEQESKKKRKDEFKRSAENLRKILLAMSRDLRVMVIKLADRLHNMNTLDGLPEEKKQRIARETMQLYAPLAHRLGIWSIKWQLEDLAFKSLYPEEYDEVWKKVNKTRDEREDDLAEAAYVIKKYLDKENIDATIQARPKHLWSIYQKIEREGVDFSEIYDLSAIRVIVNRVGECYHVLGLVHDLWMPISDRFSDYIAKPKSNMYQSLHTKVIGPRGEPLEVQIRTWDMHRTSEFGVAAHWQYKERMRSGDEFERKLSWLRQQLFDWQSDSPDAGEFLQSVANDLFTDQVFVFTPRGDVIDLPSGSTPVDFAYRIHSDVGHHCVGAKVNGRIVPLTYQLKIGDIVEVISRSNSQPSLDWLNFVKTSHAKNRIKGFHRKQHYDESVERGKSMIEKELERLGHDHKAIMQSEDITHAAHDLGYNTADEIFEAVGYGNLTATAVINKLKLEEQEKQPVKIPEKPVTRTRRKLSVTVDGLDNIMLTRAKCCQPLPGEEVIGYITRGKGVVVHSTNCPNVEQFRTNEPDRLINLDWNDAQGEMFRSEIKITAFDRVGLLNDITAILSEMKTNIASAKTRAFANKTAEMSLIIEVSDIKVLNTVVAKLNAFNDIKSVERTTSSKKKATKK